MPRLWTETIAEHRHDVRQAIIDSTASLVSERGLLGVTMSQIADRAGIGRATLYKYFPEVESILGAWHEREVMQHLSQVTEARDRASDPADRVKAVLHAYALIAHESRAHRDAELAALLHGDDRVGHAQEKLHQIVREVLADAALAGQIRTDVSADELATYCLYALAGAGRVRSRAAVRRMVAVTVDGLARTS